MTSQMTFERTGILLPSRGHRCWLIRATQSLMHAHRLRIGQGACILVNGEAGQGCTSRGRQRRRQDIEICGIPRSADPVISSQAFRIPTGAIALPRHDLSVVRF